MLDAPSLGLVSGAALVGAAGLRVAWEASGIARRGRQASRRTLVRRAEFDEQLETALRWARASQPALKAWTGTRTFRVAAVVDETPDCRSFYLVPEDGRPLPPFEPGQYLTFHLPTSDPNRPLVRCYSLSERPREDYYRVTVKRAAPPEGRGELLPGRGSNYFHREVHPGARLEVEAPQGAFFLDPEDDLPVVLCGAGVGITPLMSMAATLVHRRDMRAVHFFAGFRNRDQHLFRARLGELAADARQMRLDVSYSRPEAGDLESTTWAAVRRGRVDVARLRETLSSSNYRYYVCGPAAMMESLVPELLAWGVPARHICYEAFGPASVLGLADVAVGSTPCQVQFARSGRSLRWSGHEASLLDLAEQGGIALASGCRAGSCGQCRLTLAAGRAVHSKQPGVPLAAGECLACIARPQGDVVVEA